MDRFSTRRVYPKGLREYIIEITLRRKLLKLRTAFRVKQSGPQSVRSRTVIGRIWLLWLQHFLPLGRIRQIPRVNFYVQTSDLAGFPAVRGSIFVLAYGLLEEAIEIGIRGISRDLSLRPRRRGRCEQEDQREYGRHNPRASAEAEEKMERAKYLRWVARWGAPCCAPTQSRWGSCCRRRVVLNLGSHGHEIDFSIRTALAKRAENRWRWLLAHRQDEKNAGSAFGAAPRSLGWLERQ